MDSDSWARIATYSRRRLTRSDVYNGEGYEVEEEPNPEYLCPFCAEDFDMVGLCCHIDEMHPVSAKNGVCPVCARNVGSDLVRHLTGQHASYVSRRRRFLRRGTNSPFSILRRELRDGSLQSLFGGSSHLGSSAHTEPDPVLTSFILSSPVVDKSSSVQSLPLVEAGLPAEHSVQKLEDRIVGLSEEDLKEKARRCDFVQGLLLSTFPDDKL
ncbi:Protein DEHYDRATION-INDUCED 19 homolog 3 [Striga hermonthica]|uniref:Protein DEHYDRATION-INDUCED 19 homolog 3 n=1 Tax=Striga hermonthica TaxID=68872 RepID=A0A9N7R7W0_STRHE|nr:Protein DEHYDRATION-INDUCED 19 homolog 3 [Striga hermonthica]